MAAHHATPESVAQHCSGDMRERGRRRVGALVYMQIDIETGQIIGTTTYPFDDAAFAREFAQNAR